MDKLEKTFSAITGAIGYIISAMIGGIGLAPTFLIGIMGIDYITGLIAAVVNKELSSKVGTKGFLKKLYVLLFIAAIYMIEGFIFETQHIGDGIAIAWMAIEVISIHENGVRMGIKMPGVLKNLLAIVDEKANGKESK